MTETTSTWRGVWDNLTTPHPSITEVHERRRVRICLALMLGLFVIVTPLALVGTALTQEFSISSIILPVILLLTYVIVRSAYPQVGIWIVVFGQATLEFIFIYLADDNPELIPLAMMFLLVPILISTLIMRARATIAVSIITFIFMTLFPIIRPIITFGQMLMPYIAITLLSALASLTAYLRERDIQTIESQAEELTSYSSNLEKDVELIRTMAEVGRAITGTRDLGTLLSQIVNLIVERFDYYHAQVFLIDEAGEHAILRESTGTAGQELKARGHKLAVGSQSVIGQVTAKGSPVIASDTDTDPVHRRNELLPHTRSEMALPLRVSGRIIGALDIQSVNPNAFGDTDVSVLQTMADQLAIAIENARLFERAQRDLEDIEILNRQLTGEAWGRYLSGRSRVAPIGYRARDGQVDPLTLDRMTDEKPAEGAISVPLTVRGETIGVLDLKSKTGEAPDDETQSMLEAVAERVALALDSARLGEQAQRQAVRDQILSRLSAELQATTDLNAILRIVASEASRALKTSRGFVNLTTQVSRDSQTTE